MWTRNNDVSNWNMLKHFIYSSFSKSTTSFLCSLYYRYNSKLSSFFCILSFLVKAISIDQTFYSAMHYLAAVWLDSRHDLNIYEDQNLIWKCRCKYVALKQLNKFFSSFYSKFTRIFSFLNYDDITLMNNIQNKINNYLQNALSVCLIEFSSLDKLKIFLQDVNNKQ